MIQKGGVNATVCMRLYSVRMHAACEPVATESACAAALSIPISLQSSNALHHPMICMPAASHALFHAAPCNAPPVSFWLS